MPTTPATPVNVQTGHKIHHAGDAHAPLGSPPTEAPASAFTRQAIDPFDRDRFLLKQKHLALSETYRVFDDQDQPILFVKREGHHLRQIAAFFGGILGGAIVGAVFIAPAVLWLSEPASSVVGISGAAIGLISMIVLIIALAPKRHINIFADQSMSRELVKVFQDKKVAFINATYTIADGDYNLLGSFRKNYLFNFFRKRWYVYGEHSELLAMALEDSIWLSIARRVLGSYGAMIRTNFIIYRPDGVTKIGAFNRKFTILDKYVLDMSDDPQRSLDRRIAIALGVMLDTGEKR
jgi:uncharacterized protein YxjI